MLWQELLGNLLNPSNVPQLKGQDPHDMWSNRSPLARAGWLVLGLAFVVIGAVGIVVPGLPTTPFLVLAASCFVRSSERLYRKLLDNPIFGPPIRDFREGRGLPRRIKFMAIGTMWCFVTFALFWAIPSRLWIPKGLSLIHI